MVDAAICSWLMDNADTPIWYRTARELLHDNQTTHSLQGTLPEHPAVGLWLQNLKPQTPPQHRWMEHGSFDFCLENAMLKLIQLGLLGSMPQIRNAVSDYRTKMKSAAELPVKRKGFITAIPPYEKTKWYGDLLQILKTYRTDAGRYAFPAHWLKEQQGYAVMGRHLSFGENRRKKNWREIESTFYMQLLVH